MQLVAEVERELEVVVAQRIGGRGHLRGAQRVRVARERVEQGVRERAARDRKGRHVCGATRWQGA